MDASVDDEDDAVGAAVVAVVVELAVVVEVEVEDEVEDVESLLVDVAPVSGAQLVKTCHGGECSAIQIVVSLDFPRKQPCRTGM